jgi:hypothetical protein
MLKLLDKKIKLLYFYFLKFTTPVFLVISPELLCWLTHFNSRVRRLPNLNDRIIKETNPLNEFIFYSEDINKFEEVNIVMRGKNFENFDSSLPTFFINTRETKKNFSDDYYYATSDRTYFDAMIGKPMSKDLEIFNYNDKSKKIYYFMSLGSGIQNLNLDNPLLKNELSFNKLKDLKNSIGKNLNFKLCVCSHRFKGYNIQIGSGILSIISLLHLSKKVNVYGWDGFLNYNFPNSFYRQSYKLWSSFSDFHPISRFSAIVFNWIYAHRLINHFKSDRLFVQGQLNHIVKLKWVEKYLYKMIYKKSKI